MSQMTDRQIAKLVEDRDRYGEALQQIADGEVLNVREFAREALSDPDGLLYEARDVPQRLVQKGGC